LAFANDTANVETIPPNPAQNVRTLFADAQYTWRSIEALHKASGLPTIEHTRALLASIGAKRSELAREVYSLASSPVEMAVCGDSADARDKLTAALQDSRYSWRTIGALSEACGLPIEDTRSVLADMGARQGTIAGGKEAYTLS
jgi:hypothetical protein